MKIINKLLATTCLATLAGTANAGLIGTTVGVQTQYPTQGSVCCGEASVLVGSGVEIPLGTFPSYNSNIFIDISDFTIEYGMTAGTSYSQATFNGFRFYDVLGTVDAFAGISINAATTLAGFDVSRLSFDDDNIYMNFAGLAPNGAHSVFLDISLASNHINIPEPGSLALLGLGLVGLGYSRRNKR